MQKPLLTVFVVTYNRAEYLKNSLDSILRQTYKNYYLIILDNASTDNTTDVVKPYLRDERVRYIRHDNNIGGCANINTAIDMCETKYFVIFHDDDQMLDVMLEKEIKQLESNSSYAVVSGNAKVMDENGIVYCSEMYKSKKKVLLFSAGQYLKRFSRYGGLIICPMVMYRTEFIRRNNLHFPLNAGPAGDQAMWFGVEKAGGTLCIINEPLMCYRRYKAQDSTRNRLSMEYGLLEYVLSDDVYRKQILMSNITKYFILIKLSRLEMSYGEHRAVCIYQNCGVKYHWGFISKVFYTVLYYIVVRFKRYFR